MFQVPICQRPIEATLRAPRAFRPHDGREPPWAPYRRKTSIICR